jgi:hypothetical protein
LPEIVVGERQGNRLLSGVDDGNGNIFLYLGIAPHASAEWEHYILPWSSGDAVRDWIAEIGGYTVRQLSVLRWQLTRGAGDVGVVMPILLLAAFVGKVSRFIPAIGR